MPDCLCHEIEAAIRERYPDDDWNMDDACTAWRKHKNKLVDNNIEFDSGSDEAYGCTCPTCGRMLCGWCV